MWPRLLLSSLRGSVRADFPAFLMCSDDRCLTVLKKIYIYIVLNEVIHATDCLFSFLLPAELFNEHHLPLVKSRRVLDCSSPVRGGTLQLLVLVLRRKLLPAGTALRLSLERKAQGVQKARTRLRAGGCSPLTGCSLVSVAAVRVAVNAWGCTTAAVSLWGLFAFRSF